MYFNKLVDQYNNTFHHSFDEIPVDANYSALTEKIISTHKAPKFRVGDRVRISKYKNIFRKAYIENCSRVIFSINSVLKTNPWTNKIKDLNSKRILGSFYVKKLLLSKLQMSYYPEPDIHIINKVKLVLVLSNYATKKN